MDSQTVVNIIICVCGFLAVWAFNQVFTRIDKCSNDAKEDISKNRLDISKIEVKLEDLRVQLNSLALNMAIHYVPKTDFSSTIESIKEQFNRIEGKLDKLAERNHHKDGD